MNCYDLTDEQARSADEGTLTEIRVEIEGLPQARCGEFKMIRRQMEWHVEWQLFAGTDFIQSVVPIFEIGDTINCREAWINMWKDLGYQAGDQYEYLARIPVVGTHLDWQPASTMPDEAIRHRFTVQSVGAEQEGDKWYWVLG